MAPIDFGGQADALTYALKRGQRILWIFPLPLEKCQKVNMYLHCLSMSFMPAGQHQEPPVLISPEEQKICLHAWQQCHLNRIVT